MRLPCLENASMSLQIRGHENEPRIVGRRFALYLRSVCWITTAFRGLRCHPLTCMLLNVRLSADSIPSALTTFKISDLQEDSSHS